MPSVHTSKVKQDTSAEPSVLDAVPPDDKDYDYGPFGSGSEVNDDPTVHVHPRLLREEIINIDEDGRRQVRQIEDRQRTYIFDCPACMAEDEARMKAPPTLTAQELSRTLWLVPESQYDQQVVRAYLNARYKKPRLNAATIVAQFHGERMTFVKGSQIVVVTRRGKDGAAPGPGSRRLKDAEDKFVDMPVPPEEYISEVVESTPIVIAQCMTVTASTMFADQATDMSELVARLGERAYPYRMAIPADARDRLYVMRLNS